MHEQLEHELTEIVGKEAALVFSTGMQVNLGTISGLVGRRDVAILDKDEHAVIIDGAHLSFGYVKRFRRNNMEDLEHVLSSIPQGNGKLVAVDGLFSMEGDIADAQRIQLYGTHTDEQLDRVLEILEQVGRQVGLIN
jgi:8-amino-7-oxononanoate synthase